LSIQDYRVVEHNDQQVDETQQAHSIEHERAADEQVTAKQNEAPPKTGSKQWKALYETISNYAKDVRK